MACNRCKLERARNVYLRYLAAKQKEKEKAKNQNKTESVSVESLVGLNQETPSSNIQILEADAKKEAVAESVANIEEPVVPKKRGRKKTVAEEVKVEEEVVKETTPETTEDVDIKQE